MLRKIKNILLGTLAVILLINILLIVLVNTSFVQSKIIGYVTEWVGEKTGTEVSIGRVDIDLFHGLFLDDLYLEDQAGDTLLYAKRVSANASFLSAYYGGNLHLRRVELSDFKVYISKDSASAPFNFQFLIDAFASADSVKKDTTPSNFDLSISKIWLSNGSFKYDIHSDTLTPALFNPSHIHVDSLMAELQLQSIQLEKLEAGIASLSFREWSGFRLDDLNLYAKCRDSVITSDYLKLRMPNTQLEVATISVDLRKMWVKTHLLEGLASSAEIFPSHIYPADLKAFLPNLASMRDTLGISGSISANFPSAKISDLNFYCGDGLLCSLDAEVDDLCHLDSAQLSISAKHLFASVPSVKNWVTCFSPEVKFPEIVEKIDYAELSLFAKGTLDSLDVDLDLLSQPGELKAFGRIGYNLGTGEFHTDVDLESNGLNLATLLDTTLGLGNIAMRANALLSIPREGNPDVTISGGFPLIVYKDYSYRDVDLDVRYFNKNFLELSINLPDTNAQLSMKGHILNMGTDSMDCDLYATTHRFSPYNLHLAGENMRSFSLSTTLRLRSHGNSLDNISCRLFLDSTSLQSDTLQLFVEKSSFAIADVSDGKRRIDFKNPYFSLFIEGIYDVPSIADGFTNMMHPYLPTFFPKTDVVVDSSKNDFSFGLDIHNAEQFCQVLNLPVLLDKPTNLSGFYRPASDGFAVRATVPSMKSGENALTDAQLNLFLDKEKKMYVLDFTSKYGNLKQKYPLNLNLHTEADHDVVLLSLLYDNNPCNFKLSGKLLTLLSFEKEENGNVFAKLNFMPTDLMLNDLNVEFEPAVVELKPNNITISDFGFSLDEQPFLMANGRLSDSEKDSLIVSFHRASVHHLLSAVNKQDIPVDAFLDGTIHLYSLLGTPRFYTKGFHVDDIVYQNESIGSLLLNSRWNPKFQGMRIGAVLNRSNELAATADGYLSPANDRIKLDVHFDMIPLAMAELPLKGVLHDLSGYCGSDLQVTGKLSSPNIDGYFYFKDAKATVDYTGVAYHISDTILFSPNRIMIRDFDICDSKNKKLNISCVVHHKEFSDFRYTATFRMDNLLLLNNPEKKDSLLSGTFYASGVVDVRGDMKSAKVTGSLKNGDWTNVMIRLPESVTQVRTYDNIVYVTPSTERDTVRKTVTPATPDKFSINADVSVELTEEAVFGALISPATGDAISFRGAGNINAKYDSETSNTKLFGQYTIKNGTLKLKLSQLPIKTFSIKEGSQVYFNGDPMACSMDITAGYRVRADLALLDPSFSSMGLPSTRVPVECDLNITGNLKKFDVKYDISLPEANEDLSRTVNSLMTTDDIRIREFAYLLGFGMFYPPSGETETNSSIVSSLASSSLSGALNGALSGLLGDRVSIGADVSSSQEDLSDLEMNLSVSTNFFNNRLVLNTSLGYKTAGTAEAEASDNSLIGNFDAEYKLTKSGMFRLKAYNHANNEFYNSSSTTQGLGIVFVKEAKRFSGLFDLRPNQTVATPLLPEPTDIHKDSVEVVRDTMAIPYREKNIKKERRPMDE